MVTSRHQPDRQPIGIPFSPQHRHKGLPVEVLNRSEVVDRIAARELASRQRAEFHQLVVCTHGSGTHNVDYEPITLQPGTLLRIHPGQVQQFVTESELTARMVVWPASSHQADPIGRVWFPSSTDATSWTVDDELLAKILGWVDELRQEQERFNGSPRNSGLMQALLAALLLRLAIELPDSAPTDSRLPTPYLDFRELIERRLYERPGITDIARDLGYSSRTLDRACQQVSGQTAKQVLDERVALEVRRLLTHSERPVARIAVDFGFSDPSNFSKFVKRHLGDLPRGIRDEALGRTRP